MPVTRRCLKSIRTAVSGFLLAIALSACSGEGVQPATVEAPTTIGNSETVRPAHPNIIFVLVDDMGYGDVPYNGGDIATPTLDRIAASGVVLSRNYAYPICSPTRAALLTGRSPLEFGIDGPMADTAGLPTDVKLMPEYLKDLGYQTFMVGKWHLGLGETAYHPYARGFDYYYGHLGGYIDFYTKVYQGGYDWQRNGTSLREEGFATDLKTADAVRVIKARDATAPFMLYLSYNAPHTPLQTLPQPTGLNAGLDGDRKVYGEMVTNFDAGIGAVIDTLSEEGILQDTIIVFSSDNGGLLTAGASNGVLRGGKGGALEGGMRVPGMIWWPGTVEGGRTLDQMIAMHDWLPTLLEAIGDDPNRIENVYGQSMWPAILDNTVVERAPTTIGVNNNMAVFKGPWKLTSHTPRGANQQTSVGLYNIEQDPLEAVDLKDAHPDIFAELSEIKNALSYAESLRDRGLPPERYFRDADGQGWNFEVRLEETGEPWAELASQSDTQ